MNLLCFNLAEKDYAVPVESVREVRRLKQVTPIPKAPDFVDGVVTLRGRVVPVISLRRKLGLAAGSSSALNRVLITRSAGHLLGVVVDGVVGVVRVNEADIEPPDEVLKSCGYLTGLAKAGGRLTLIIDIEKLLSGEDLSGLAEIHEKVAVKRIADNGTGNN